MVQISLATLTITHPQKSWVIRYPASSQAPTPITATANVTAGSTAAMTGSRWVL